MVLHALDVSRNNLFTEMVVSCSDSDMLLLLLNCFENLPYCITLKTSHHKHDLQKKRKNLNPGITKAVLGFYAFLGCDETGSFYGFDKKNMLENMF